MNNRTLWIVLIVVGIALGFGGCSTYNNLVNKETDVETAWANVQSAYQRRADLIPNLVNTVKGAANFEQQTLSAVSDARARAMQVNIDPSRLDPESMKKFQEAQSGLTLAVGNMFRMVSENYPDLKASQNFLELQSQLEGTENRIKVERDKFNKVVSDYNKSVRRFPANIFAGMMGFERKAVFEAETSAQQAPQVQF